MPDSPSSIIGRIASEFTARQQAGENPSVEEYAERHPALAEVIRDVFPLLLAAPPRQETPSFNSATGPAPPLDLPGYEILAELGRGGMGVVYKARQVRLNRLVALKMVLAGVYAEPHERARFLGEAELAARLHHPHIAHVYEMGEHQGQPYFAMEFVQGETLADRLAGQPQPARPAAELVRTLALAVEHAHQAGIIHRDLKPANVLLEGDHPRIVDFGLARHQNTDSGLTASGDIVGTPSYVAPEQALGGSRKVGPAADVYALGAILYECLTGRPPFRAATVLDTLYQVATQDPVPPSRLNADVPRDLETVCLACLAKEPARRYPSAQALADDLSRYLEGRPVLARPASWWDHTAKWAKRNPALAGVSAVLGLGTVAALCVVTWLWQSAVAAEAAARASETLEKEARLDAENAETRAVETARREAREKTRAVRAEDAALARLYQRNLALGDAQWRAGNVAAAEALLGECPVHLRGWEWRHLWARVREQDAGVVFQDLVSLRAAAARPDGLLAVSGLSRVLLLRPGTRKPLLTLTDHPMPVRSLVFSPDGRWLAGAGERSEVPFLGSSGQVKLWDAETGKPRVTLTGMDCAAFRADGLLLACGGSRNTVSLYGPPGGRRLASLAGHSAAVSAAAFSPRGDLLASGDEAGNVLLWRQEGGGFLAAGSSLVGQLSSPAGGWLAPVALLARAELPFRKAGTGAAHTGAVTRLAFDPAGNRLASAGRERTVRVWEAQTGNRLAELHGHDGWVHALCWSTRGEELVIAGVGGAVRVWDLATLREKAVLAGHSGVVADIVAGEGGRFYSAGTDGALRRWDLTRMPAVRSLVGHTRPIQSVAVSPSGRWCVSLADDGGLSFWDLNSGEGRTAGQHPRGARVAVHPEEHVVASGGMDGAVLLWDGSTGKLLRRLTGPPASSAAVMSLAFHPGGKSLATGHADGEVKLWEVAGGKEKARWKLTGEASPVSGVVFHDGGRRLTAVSINGQLRTWELESGAVVRTLPTLEQTAPMAITMSPDGRLAAWGGANYNQSPALQVWDVAAGRLTHSLTGHATFVTSLGFSPDGRLLASGSGDGEVRLWDPRTGNEQARLSVPGGGLASSLVFDPRGGGLICGGHDGGLRVFEGPASKQRLVFRHSVPFARVAVHRAGRLTAVGDLRGTVRLWDLATGQDRGQWRAEGVVWSADFDAKGAHLAGGLDNGMVQVWRTEDGKEAGRLQASKTAVHAVAFSREGLLAAAGDDGVVRVWRFGRDEKPRTFEGHTGSVRKVVFSPDGRLLASASRDGSIRVWDVESGKERERFGGAGAFEAVCISPGGKLLAAAGRDGTLHLWDLPGRRKLRAQRAHETEVMSADFSPDGTRLVTTGEDRLVKVWDVETGRCLAALSGHTALVTGVAFTADDLLVSSSFDRTVRVWDLKP